MWLLNSLYVVTVTGLCGGIMVQGCEASSECIRQLPSSASGVCVDVDAVDSCVCLQVYDPVCCEGRQYGNQCSAGCAGETALCESGECAPSKTSCGNGLDRCQQPYRCRKNPECEGTTLMCANDKVCYQFDGQCARKGDCRAGYDCMARGINTDRKFCIQFQ